MASKISMVRFKLSGALTHLPGSNVIDIPYAGGDSQAEFSTTTGVNVLIINGGINTARSGKTIVDSGRTRAEDILERYHGAWNRDVTRLFTEHAY